MYREAVAQLESWLNEEIRKPLLITGSRSVGKTWIARDFGDAFFDQTVTIDFAQEDETRIILEQELDKNQILRILGNKLGKMIEPDKTFIIFEDVQLLKNPLKFFEFLQNSFKEYFICGTSYFTPKHLLVEDKNLDLVYIKNAYPLSFGEFLIANKENEICSLIENHKNKPLDKEKHFQAEELFRTYLIVGGMPESVKIWIEEKDLELIKYVKRSILNKYFEDFEAINSKAEQKKVFEIWNSMARQLDREVKKFHFDLVRLTARKREYQTALDWLIDRNYIQKHPKIKEENSFQVFIADIGLLSLIFDIDYKDLNQGVNSFLCNNAALIEQFVFQELIGNTSIDKLYYWNSDATARIEFLFEDSGNMIPIEINIDGNKKSQSLRVFREKYKNPISIRITYDNFGMEDGVLSIPIYAVWNL